MKVLANAPSDFDELMKTLANEAKEAEKEFQEKLKNVRFPSLFGFLRPWPVRN